MELLAMAGGSGRERKVLEWIAGRLRRAGAPADAIRFDRAHRRSPLGGEVGNLVCKLPGTVRRGRRLLAAHVDTVPLCEGTRPVVRGNWVVPADGQTALGADNRAGAAVLLATALEIVRRKLESLDMTLPEADFDVSELKVE